VFDVNNKRVVHLSAPPESCSFTDAEQELMLGAHISDDVAVAMCEEGRIDPHTMQPFPRPRPPQNKQQRPGNAYGGKLGFRRESGLEPYVPRYPDIRSHMSGRNNAADGKIASEHDDVNPAGAGKTANASARMRSCISTTKEEACSKKRKGPPGGDVVSWIATSMLGTSQPSMMGAPEDDGLVCVDDDDDHEEEEEACQRLLVPTGHKSSCKLFAIELQEKRQTAFLSLQEGPDTELQAAAASSSQIGHESVSSQSTDNTHKSGLQRLSEHPSSTAAQPAPAPQRRALFALPPGLQKVPSATSTSSKTPPTIKKRPDPGKPGE
jgi:hypothetical protein